VRHPAYTWCTKSDTACTEAGGGARAFAELRGRVGHTLWWWSFRGIGASRGWGVFMVFVWRSGRRRRRGGGGGGGCMRDACLLEGGCCLGEALTGNCLLGAMMVIPQLLRTVTTSPGRTVLSHTVPGRTVSEHGGGGAGDGRTGRRLIAAIGVYQERVSPRLAGCCRFEPSCSEFAVQAIAVHGAVRGSRLTAARLLRCRPGGRRGPDPVPAAE